MGTDGGSVRPDQAGRYLLLLSPDDLRCPRPAHAKSDLPPPPVGSFAGSFKNGGQCRTQALATETLAIEVTFPCRVDAAHVERSRAVAAAVVDSRAAAAEEVHFRAAAAAAVYFRGATGPVSEPIHAALAADEAHFAGATRSADAGISPDASSMDVTRSAKG